MPVEDTHLLRANGIRHRNW